MGLGRRVSLFVLSGFILSACSNVLEGNVGTPQVQAQDDLVALLQYKPGVKVVKAKDLSDGALANAESNDELMVIQNYTFKDGTVYEYSSIGDQVVFGDMLLGTLKEFKAYLQSVDKQGLASEFTLDPQGAFYKVVNTWPNGEIVFEIPSLDVYNATQKTQIQNAMQEITNRTNVGFRGVYNVTSGNRIRFTNPSAGCSATVGMPGGLQYVNLADNCFGSSTYLGTIFHELGHSAGLLHEHQRDDRGDKIVPSPYLTAKGRAAIANTIPAGTRTAYEYTSNMHYPKFTSDSSFTTRTDQPLFTTPGYSGAVGNSWISAGDVATYNLHYR